MPGKCEQIDLTSEAPIIYTLLSPYTHLHSDGGISDADYIAIFILIYLAHRRPRRWCSSLSKAPLFGDVTHPNVNSMFIRSLTEQVKEIIDLAYIAKKFKLDEIELLQNYRLVDLFNHLTLAGIKHNADHYINRFVVMHYLEERPVRLLHYVPTPIEVLTQQAHGERVVTMFITVEELSRCHVSKLRYMAGGQEHARDPFEFLLHDISHMEHFLSPDTYYEQVGFFSAMLTISNESSIKGFFTRILGHSKSFWYEMEYVLSDMNCFSTHLLRYFHAKWITSFQMKFRSVSENEPTEEIMIAAENDEWEVIIGSLFKRNMDRQFSTDMNNEIDDSIVEMEDSVYICARDAAMLLNCISHRTLNDLSMEQWESIRAFFAWRGNVVCKRRR